MATPSVTPVSMLSGFLGAGKTTVLRYLLENTTDKVACIVNDVASINVDAKLIRNDRNRSREEGSREESIKSTADLTDTIELANGCACCNLQDELFASFEQVVSMADKKGVPYDRIVLENSGVAEPLQIREKFTEAAQAGHPLMSRIELQTLITVVDSGAFLQDYASKEALAARPDLGEGGNLRPVVDLLVEQVECADFVILNKTDRLDASSREQLIALVKSLNPIAEVVACENGRVPLDKVFGKGANGLMAKMNIEGQHRGAVAAALEVKQAQETPKEAAAGASHSAHTHDDADHEHCEKCDHEHSHDHNHDHGDHDHCEKCDHGHSHDHGHDHGDHSKCEVGQCEHAHDHADGHAGHAHKHEHSHAHQETRAAERFGIKSFVYARRRPFHPKRLRELLLKWFPVTTNKALEGAAPENGDSPIKTVLRSKGFMWMSNNHTTAYYWSHAGGHFDMRDEGDWWAAVPDEDWPSDPAQLAVITGDFDKNGTGGDRRQEIVFIGVGMDETAITQQLDSALLTESELVKYNDTWVKLPDPAHAHIK